MFKIITKTNKYFYVCDTRIILNYIGISGRFTLYTYATSFGASHTLSHSLLRFFLLFFFVYLI
jgi:hypothetical protein